MAKAITGHLRVEERKGARVWVAKYGRAEGGSTRKVLGPAWANGPVAGMTEHLASWPFVGLADRFHPAREDFPQLAGDRAAFAQATWRHLLFGTVLGETERRLNRR